MGGNQSLNVFFTVVAAGLEVSLKPLKEGLFVSDLIDEFLKFSSDWECSSAAIWVSWHSNTSVASVGNVSVEDGSESGLELWESLTRDSLEDNE